MRCGSVQINSYPDSDGGKQNQRDALIPRRMDKIKIILITIAVVLGSLGLLALIGLISSLIQSLFWIGLICVAGYVGVKLLARDKPSEADSLNAPHSLKQVERTLEEYRRKLK